VTEGNMMQYLGIIEQRTNEILQMYTAAQMKETGHDETSPEIQVTKLAAAGSYSPDMPGRPSWLPSLDRARRSRWGQGRWRWYLLLPAGS